MPSIAAIDTFLYGYPTINLLGPYGAGYTVAEITRCPKTVYVPDPYVGLLLGNNLTLVEVWKRLQVVMSMPPPRLCWPIIDWMNVIDRSGPDKYSAFVFPELLAPLPEALLL